MQKRFLVILIALILSLGAVILVLAPNESHWRFEASEYPAYIPQAGDSFAKYLAENQQRIRQALNKFYAEKEQPFGPGYDLEKVLAMRSPYELRRNDSCSAQSSMGRRGFLLIHGLSDSPYLLTATARSLSERYPCSVVRGLLTPGHGTVPGDLLNVHRENWKQTVAWGVNSFSGQVEQLVLVGYSNGAALSMHYANDNREALASGESLVAGSVLLSPGLKPLDTRAFLSPWVKRVVPWVNQDADSDAVKYESFTMNAAAEFYRLGQVLEADDFAPLALPTLMVVSSEDSTVDNQSAVRFFCEKISTSLKRLLWYSTADSNSQPTQQCAGVDVQMLQTSSPQFKSFSHVGLTLPPSDSHYGFNGHQKVCLAYTQVPDLFDRCLVDDAMSVYAENTFRDEQGFYSGDQVPEQSRRLVRRSTFNPDYENMMQEVFDFIDSL